MSFGFAPGDIIAAVTLVAHIYEKCFTKAQAAGEFGGFRVSGVWGALRQGFSLNSGRQR